MYVVLIYFMRYFTRQRNPPCIVTLPPKLWRVSSPDSIPDISLLWNCRACFCLENFRATRTVQLKNGNIVCFRYFHLRRKDYAWGGGGEGGLLPEKLGGGVRPASQNPYPIYDQNLRFLPPY